MKALRRASSPARQGSSTEVADNLCGSSYDYASMHLYEADLSQRFCPALESRRLHQTASDPELCTKFGNQWVWTPLHKTAEELEPLRHIGDPQVDELLEHLAPQRHDDFLAALQRAADTSPESRSYVGTSRGHVGSGCVAGLCLLHAHHLVSRRTEQ